MTALATGYPPPRPPGPPGDALIARGVGPLRASLPTRGHRSKRFGSCDRRVPASTDRRCSRVGGRGRRMRSAPGWSRLRAGVAQLVAQTTCNRQVVGSIPTAGSRKGPTRSPTHRRPVTARRARVRCWCLRLSRNRRWDRPPRSQIGANTGWWAPGAASPWRADAGRTREQPAGARWGGAQASRRPAQGADRQPHGARCLEGHHPSGPERVHLLGRGCQTAADPRTSDPPDPGGAGGRPTSALLLARVHAPRAHRQIAVDRVVRSGRDTSAPGDTPPSRASGLTGPTYAVEPAEPPLLVGIGEPRCHGCVSAARASAAPVVGAIATSPR